MNGCHGSHDADPGPGEPGERLNLAPDVHPHLEDHRAVLRTEPQERQRNPDLVVGVSLALQRRKRGREDGRRRVLGGRLREAARDPDDERVESRPPGGADRLEPAQRVRHPDDGHVAERIELREVERATDEQGGCPGRHGGPEEPVTVGPLARHGHE